MQILATCLTNIAVFAASLSAKQLTATKSVLSPARSRSQPLFSSGAGGTILTPLPFCSPASPQHTHTPFFNVGTQPDGAGVQNLQFPPLAIVGRLPANSETFYKSISPQPQRHMRKPKCPELFQSWSSLSQSSVARLISLADILLFPSVSQYAPMVALKNPSSVPISSMHVIAFDTRTLLLQAKSIFSGRLLLRHCLHLLFFAYFVKVWSYRPVSSLLIENTEASKKKGKEKEKNLLQAHVCSFSNIADFSY